MLMLLSTAIVINEQLLSFMLHNITFVGICFTYTHAFKMLKYFRRINDSF